MFSLATMVVALMAGGVAPSDSTEAIASRYLELTFDQRYEALRDVYAEDVLFVDPKPNGGDRAIRALSIHHYGCARDERRLERNREALRAAKTPSTTWLRGNGPRHTRLRSPCSIPYGCVRSATPRAPAAW